MTAPVPGEPQSLTRLELLLGGLTALGPLSIDLYLPALPAIGAEFTVDTAAVELSLSAFFAGFAIGQLVAGPIVDRLGRVGPLQVALTIYVLASLGCALAPSNDLLIACRFLQALGGATAVVVPRAIVRDLRSGAAAVHMLSRLMLVMGVAPIVAPLLGGWVLHAFGWRAIFVLLAGFGALALVASTLALRSRAAPPGPQGPLRMAAQIAALAREPDFRTYALCGAFTSAGMFAYISGSSFVFIEVHHVDPRHYGWFFGANALGLIAASQLNRLLVGRFSSEQVLRGATGLATAAALTVLAVVWTDTGGLWGVAGALFVFVLTLRVVAPHAPPLGGERTGGRVPGALCVSPPALAFLAPNATAMALERHGERAGLASAVLGSLQFVIAATASWAVSALHDDTAAPMAAVVAGASCLALLCFALRRRATAAG